MKKRPRSVRLLAYLFFLGPLGLVAELVYLYDIPIDRWYVVFTVRELWNWQAWTFIVVTPFIGYCVWSVHRWGYLVLMGFSGLILVNNLAVWLSGRSRSGALERLAMLAALAALVLVEVRKEFSAPYFNPRLRWWEQAQRFVTDRIHVVLKSFGTNERLFEANSFDVSETGIYMASAHEARIGDVYNLEVLLPGGRTAYATGEVVWVHGGGDRNPQGFGCRFTATSREFKRELRAAVKDLHAAMKDR